MRIFAVAASALALALLSAGCAPNLCQRRSTAMGKCAGTDVTYRPDELCEANLERCPAGNIQQFEAYVMCLESMAQCSLDTVNGCAARYPGGVNLMCPATE
jgi:uncharacterized protein with NAD-binding domain and iron-sulfur cluster